MLGMAEPLTVLVIDDEQHVRDVFAHAAGNGGRGQGLGGGQRTAGRERACHARHKPAVVLLDLNMAGQTGIETLSQIVGSNPNAIVIVVTSQNDRETRAHLPAARRGPVLLKSLPKEELPGWRCKKFLSEAGDND